MGTLGALFFITAFLSISAAHHCYIGSNDVNDSFSVKVPNECTDSDRHSEKYCTKTFYYHSNTTYLRCAHRDDNCPDSKELYCVNHEWGQECCCSGNLCNDDPLTPITTTTKTPKLDTTLQHEPTTNAEHELISSTIPYAVHSCYTGHYDKHSSAKVPKECTNDGHSKMYCRKIIHDDQTTFLRCAQEGECDDSKLSQCVFQMWGLECCCKGNLCNDEPPITTTEPDPSATTESPLISSTLHPSVHSCYAGKYDNSSSAKVPFECINEGHSKKYCRKTTYYDDNTTYLNCADVGECNESKLSKCQQLSWGQICCCKGNLCNHELSIPIMTTTKDPETTTNSDPEPNTTLEPEPTSSIEPELIPELTTTIEPNPTTTPENKLT